MDRRGVRAAVGEHLQRFAGFPYLLGIEFGHGHAGSFAAGRDEQVAVGAMDGATPAVLQSVMAAASHYDRVWLAAWISSAFPMRSNTSFQSPGRG